MIRGETEQLPSNYSEFHYYSESQYLVSILKAVNLFELYLSSNERIQKYILKGCQRVFDGEITLEEFFESIDVTYDNSLNSQYVKSLVARVQ